MNLIKVNNLNLSIHEKEILKGLSFEGEGCAISLASASILTDIILSLIHI